jgi:hypothetical protein
MRTFQPSIVIEDPDERPIAVVEITSFWDEKWEEMLNSRASLMDFERMYAKMDHDHATGNDKDYLTDTDADLEKLFRT